MADTVTRLPGSPPTNEMSSSAQFRQPETQVPTFAVLLPGLNMIGGSFKVMLRENHDVADVLSYRLRGRRRSVEGPSSLQMRIPESAICVGPGWTSRDAPSVEEEAGGRTVRYVQMEFVLVWSTFRPLSSISVQ